MAGGSHAEAPGRPAARGPGFWPLALLAAVVVAAAFTLVRDSPTTTPPPTATTAALAEPPTPVPGPLVGSRPALISCVADYEPASGPSDHAEVRFDLTDTSETAFRDFIDLTVFFSYEHLPEATARVFAAIRAPGGAAPLASAMALAPEQMSQGETILLLDAVDAESGTALDVSCRLVAAPTEAEAG